MKHRFGFLATALVLGGCASFSEDGGFAAVERDVKARTGQEARWIRNERDAGEAAARVKKLLAAPLGPEQAVQIALLNNSGLQAAYAELGIAESALVQAGRLVNPLFGFARLERGDSLEIERSLLFDVLSLITMPKRVHIANQRFDEVRLRASGEALQVAAEARRAWFAAVAADQRASYFERVKETAEAGAELARRMAAAGNFTKLQYLREQAFHAESVTQLAAARQQALAARERLTRVLGLDAPRTAFVLPGRLPDLPQAPRELADVESAAIRERLDVQAAKRGAEALARSLGLTRATRFVNLLEFGVTRTSESGEPPQKGWEVELQLPIFDSGDARLARAQHLYMQAVRRAAQFAVDARSQAREAYASYRTTYDTARQYRDEIVPLRRQISEENALRFGAMQIGAFELLADARVEVEAETAALEAQRDFWLAEANLQMALTGGSPGVMPASAGAAAMPVGEAGGGH